MARFATAADLAKYLQTTFDATQITNAELLLDLVSAEIQAYTGQTIAEVEDDEVTIDGTSGEYLFLPQLPVNAVSSITVAGTTITSSDYHVYADLGYVRRANGGSWGYLPRTVVVTYDHGYATIPDAIRGVCLAAAARKF